MSNDQFNEDHDNELDDAELDSPAAAPAKKSNLPLMAGAGVALAVVVGFAGFQIYNKFLGGAPAPDAGYANQAPMQPPAPMGGGQMAAPGMQGGPGAQPVNINAPLQGGAMPVVPPAPGAAAGPGAQVPMGAQPPAPAVVGGGADLGVKPLDPVGGQPAALQSPAALGGPAAVAPGMSAAPASAPAARGPVDVAAIEELKKQTAANAERIDSVEARLKSLEERLAKFEGKRPAKAVKADAAEERASAKSESHAERQSERLSKGAKAIKGKLKGAASKKSDWKKAPAEARSEEVVDAPVAPKKNPADIVLPPAPVFSPVVQPKQPAADASKPADASKGVSSAKPVTQSAAEAMPVIRPSVGDIKVQAVIPGRVWLS